jgi:hypothetical protein
VGIIETSQIEEPVKTPTSKTQWNMYTDFVFYELGIVEKLLTGSRTSHSETPISKKNRRCKVCKLLNSLR